MDKNKQLHEAISAADRIVILTGAGVSVPSGIPDYRSKDGLYAGKHNPEYLLSETCLQTEPDVFYEFVTQNLYYPNAKPNLIHTKMAELGEKKAVTIITQNIDGLHEAAGSKSVINFHGSLYHCYCEKCGQDANPEDYLRSDTHQNCGGRLRPDVVLYGEGISEAAIQGSIEALRAAELVLIVGTSFKVSPFCNLIDFKRAEAPVFAVNKEPIFLSQPFTMIQDDARFVFADI
ncbi:NAD-dependent deacetylase [Listeria floridensis FSL S10-1187]|uniref:protein acetyllysine N-acetyltransferase n=1 Tax=Listeria floridensis FSL S10-1187 TaxID=1265817 RepID=A0ABN0RDE3_9LIST|nr:NAD-dependent protein deacylase [Listeria floridensis]EUJ28862.1 NAD-dependent deacetylase [Listeria floridensis FSL S10-1187]